jgi:hypothetical protein
VSTQNGILYAGVTSDIAGEELRLYPADRALERARLALDVPAAFASPAVALAG